MKKTVLLIAFALLSASLLKAQNLILPSAHSLNVHQPAWYQDLPQSQEFDLVAGFNWWSSYIDLTGNGLEKLENGLGSDAYQIKSHGPFTNYNATNGSWSGNLTELDNSQMYIIQVTSETSSFQMEGTVVNPSDVTINLQSGWNWIGYPCSSSIPINDALANYTANNNDIIKYKNKYATYSSELESWQGNLNDLVPGNGYILLSLGEASSFHFAFSSKNEPVENKLPNTVWKADANDYALNMNALASVQLFGDEVNSEDYELGVFHGDECRGTVQLMNVNGRYLAFLTAFGNEGETLQFRLLDRNTGTVYTTDHQPIVYSDNAVVGTFDDPCQIDFRNTLSCEETLAGMLKVYPNPMSNHESLTVTLPENQTYAEGVKIQVVNLLGQMVKEEAMYGNRCTVNGLSSGLYTLRVLAGSTMIYNNKLIVK